MLILACDIDLSCYSSGDGWRAIGAPSGHGEWFNGIFNGNGHVVKICTLIVQITIWGYLDMCIAELGEHLHSYPQYPGDLERCDRLCRC